MTIYDGTRFFPPAPVAIATLRKERLHSARAEIELQIDTGADMTVVPRSAAIALGITPTEIAYEITGWDGITQVVPSIRATLTVLGRNYRGVFLLTSGDTGLLGRDLMNDVCLIFDGPKQSWNRLLSGRN